MIILKNLLKYNCDNMKKIIIILLILFIPILVKADLSKDQQNDIATFSIKMIQEGNKAPHLDNKGFSILAYDQNARTDGFNNRLAYLSRDYKSINEINGYKWVFDCSSFAAYVYYHCFNVPTFANSNGAPYVVTSFIGDASNQKYFYVVGSNLNTSTMDYSRLQKGDLIIFVSTHIMVYVGDGNIAHFSSTAIQKGTNLGAEVVNLKLKYPGRTATVIRIRDGIIDKNAKANMKITWPDTNQVQDLGETIAKKDNKPKVTLDYKLEDNKGTIYIDLSDDNGLSGYYISNKKGTPNSWKKISNAKKYSTTFEPDSNGTYYCYVKDTKNQITSAKIKVTGLDKDKPIISTVVYKYIKENDSFNLEIRATDNNPIVYALDNNNFQESNLFNNVSIGNHKVYVKDTSNNITEFEFNLSSDLIPTINLNYEKNFAKTVNVKIDGVDTEGISGYSITRTNSEPKSFLTYNNNASYIITTNGDYYFWVRNTRGNVNYQKITINNIDSTPPTISDVSIEAKNGYFNVTITASDNGCGISSYSLDGSNYQKENTFSDAKVLYNKVFVKDKCNNVGTYDIDLSNIPMEEESSSTTILLILIILVFIGLIYYNLKDIIKR